MAAIQAANLSPPMMQETGDDFMEVSLDREGPVNDDIDIDLDLIDDQVHDGDDQDMTEQEVEGNFGVSGTLESSQEIADATMGDGDSTVAQVDRENGLDNAALTTSHAEQAVLASGVPKAGDPEYQTGDFAEAQISTLHAECANSQPGSHPLVSTTKVEETDISELPVNSPIDEKRTLEHHSGDTTTKAQLEFAEPPVAPPAEQDSQEQHVPDPDGDGTEKSIPVIAQELSVATTQSTVNNSTQVNSTAEGRAFDVEAVLPLLMIYYDETEKPMFSPNDTIHHQGEANGLLQDVTLAQQSLKRLLNALKEALIDDGREEHELEISFDELGLQVSESCEFAVNFTLSHVVETYARLLQNDGILSPPSLFCAIRLRIIPSGRWDLLTGMVAKEEGLSDLPPLLGLGEGNLSNVLDSLVDTNAETLGTVDLPSKPFEKTDTGEAEPSTTKAAAETQPEIPPVHHEKSVDEDLKPSRPGTVDDLINVPQDVDAQDEEEEEEDFEEPFSDEFDENAGDKDVEDENGRIVQQRYLGIGGPIATQNLEDLNHQSETKTDEIANHQELSTDTATLLDDESSKVSHADLEHSVDEFNALVSENTVASPGSRLQTFPNEDQQTQLESKASELVSEAEESTAIPVTSAKDQAPSEGLGHINNGNEGRRQSSGSSRSDNVSASAVDNVAFDEYLDLGEDLDFTEDTEVLNRPSSSTLSQPDGTLSQETSNKDILHHELSTPHDPNIANDAAFGGSGSIDEAESQPDAHQSPPPAPSTRKRTHNYTSMGHETDDPFYKQARLEPQ